LVKKGNIPWNKGKHNIYSSSVLKSNSDKHKNSYEERYGTEKAQQVKDKIRIKLKQRKLSDIHKERIGLNTIKCLKGKSYKDKYGEERAEKIKEQISKNNWSKRMKGNFPESTLIKKRDNMLGEKNPMWNLRGERSHAWLGGISFQPYPPTFNKHFKKQIKERDGYICMKCNVLEIDARVLYKQGLVIHHCNYCKDNTCESNCITLCNRCNSEVNFNRELWITFFQSLLSQKYGYEYNSVEDENSFDNSDETSTEDKTSPKEINSEEELNSQQL
jgi:hypothetical protein